MIAPLKISLVVQCSAQHAFDTWALRASAWWPRSATMSQAEGDLIVVFEPHQGGRIFERTPSGTEISWGQVTVWEPPRRLGYLWHIATDPASATDVEILFTELEGPATRVDIEHRGWERLGSRGPGWRDTNQGGWDGVLPAYEAACKMATR